MTRVVCIEIHSYKDVFLDMENTEKYFGSMKSLRGACMHLYLLLGGQCILPPQEHPQPGDSIKREKQWNPMSAE